MFEKVSRSKKYGGNFFVLNDTNYGPKSRKMSKMFFRVDNIGSDNATNLSTTRIDTQI